MTEKQQRIVLLILALIAAAAYVLIGGSTVGVYNRTSDDLCEVYLAYNPTVEGWGRDRLTGRIPPGQSRDVQLPIYFGWLAADRAAGFSGRVLTCDGVEVSVEEGLQGKLILLEVR